METGTSQHEEIMYAHEFTRLSPEEQEVIRREVQDGRIEIIPTPGAKRIIYKPIVDDSRYKTPRIFKILSLLHPKYFRASGELLSTIAEERATYMIGEGNLRQLRQLQQMLYLVDEYPLLGDMVLNQLKSDGIEDFNELAPSDKISRVAKAISLLTSMQTQIQEYERMQGETANKLAKMDARIDEARQLSQKTPQLREGTEFLGQYNEILEGYLPEFREKSQLEAEEARIELAYSALKLMNRISGVIGGTLGGVAGGILSIPAYMGKAGEMLGVELPVPLTGGFFGIAAYLKLVDSPNPYGAILSVVGCMVGLPTLFGVVRGYYNKITKTESNSQVNERREQLANI